MQRFEYSDFKSNRFWAIAASNNEVSVQYGRIGNAGVHKSRRFATHEEALAAREKYIAQMLEEGYAPAGQARIYTVSNKPLGKTEQQQLATLLEQASSSFADHATNDYVMLRTPGTQALVDAVHALFPPDETDSDSAQIHASYSQNQGWTEIESPATHLAVCDYQLMTYLSECLQNREDSRTLSKTQMTALADVAAMLAENEYGFLPDPEDGGDITFEETEENKALVRAIASNAHSAEQASTHDQTNSAAQCLETCSLWLAGYLAKRCYAIADDMPEDTPGHEAPPIQSSARTLGPQSDRHDQDESEPSETDNTEEDWDDEEDIDDEEDEDEAEYDGVDPALSLLSLKDEIYGRLKDLRYTARVFLQPQPLQNDGDLNTYERDDVTGYFHWDFDTPARLDDSFTIGVLTCTDEECEKLKADTPLWDDLKAQTKEACEEAGIQFSGFSVQSDETIQRDGGGFWPPFILEPCAQPQQQSNEENTQRYEHNEHAEEFWEISQTGCMLQITFGSPFSTTRRLIKTFANPSQANAEQECMIAEKIAQGYIREPLPSAWDELCIYITQQLETRVGGAQLADVKCNSDTRQVHVQILTDCDTECEALSADTNFADAVISFANTKLSTFGYTCELAFQSAQSNESRAWDDDESEDYDEDYDND